MSDPVVVFRTHSDAEASIVRGLLDTYGIECIVASDVTHAVFPILAGALGEVRISVRADVADEAKRIIEGYRERREMGPRVVPFEDAVSALERRLEHRFRDRSLLEHALTHRSRAHEDQSGNVTDNESLEFLGDAVLGLVVAEMLFHEFPDFDEGQKSKLKAALVAEPALALVATRLGVGDAMLLGRGEEKTGGRHKQALLADMCEAIIAALYLDDGLEPVRALVRREFGELIARVREPGLLTALTGDYKSALQEYQQAKNGSMPEYRVLAETGPAHRRLFEVEVVIDDRPLARGEGRSKKEAEQAAARQALENLGGIP